MSQFNGSVSEVFTSVKYTFEENSVEIIINSNAHPWKYLIPNTICSNDDNSVISVECRKDSDGCCKFLYSICEKEDKPSKLVFKNKDSSADMEFEWEGSVITTSSGDKDEFLISISSKEMDQASYFKKLKTLNESILVKSEISQYIPSGIPLVGKKKENGEIELEKYDSSEESKV